MSLIEFQDYPSTETALNAENLNYNFNVLKGNILYENSNGSTGDITVPKTIVNSKAIEIIYGADGVFFSTGKIYEPFEKKVSLFTPFSSTENANVYLYVSNYLINENKIQFLKADNKYITDTNTIDTYGQNSYIKIYKVISYE